MARLLTLPVNVGASLALLGVFSCGKLAGLGDYGIGPAEGADAAGGGGNTATLCGGFKFEDGTCNSCMESCCEVLEQCSGNRPCADWIACTAACEPDKGACKQACYQLAGATNPLMGRVAACLFENCTVECGAGWDGALSAGCEDCTRSTCAAQTLACAGDPGCVSVLECLVAANCVVSRNPSCATGCYEHRLFDNAALLDLLICADPGMGGCASACGYGRHLDCSGYSWSVGTDVNVAVTLRLFESPVPELPPDRVAGRPLAGMPVKACREADSSCSSPHAEGVTNPRGIAELSLPSAFKYYFEADIVDGEHRLKVISYPGRQLRGSVTYPMNVFLAWKDWVIPPEPDVSGVPRWEPGTGWLVVLGRDCTGHYIDQASFRLDHGLLPWGYQPRFPGLPGDPNATTGTGAYFMNLQPGFHDVRAEKGGQIVGEARQVIVKAHALTTIQLYRD